MGESMITYVVVIGISGLIAGVFGYLWGVGTVVNKVMYTNLVCPSGDSLKPQSNAKKIKGDIAFRDEILRLLNIQDINSKQREDYFRIQKINVSKYIDSFKAYNKQSGLPDINKYRV
jgi:hypothetical protein